MSSAELVFKTGFAPNLSVRHLETLRDACRIKDCRLSQGSTTAPPPLMCVQNWPVEAACAVGFMGWQGDDGNLTVGKVEEFFAMKCFQADQTLGEPAGCRWFLNWFDETPRDQMLTELAGWCDDVLADRDEAGPILVAG